jgi:hypothetical protein
MRMIVREALERDTDFEVCAEAVVSCIRGNFGLEHVKRTAG